jgi:hypothetical protein
MEHQVPWFAVYLLWLSFGWAIAFVSVLAIGRVTTLAGWGVIAVALCGTIAVARLSHGRFPGGVALLRAGMRNRVARVLVLAGWVWSVDTSSFGLRADFARR